MKQVVIFLIAFFSCAAMKAQYKIGDIYNEGGLKGIVVRVDDKGLHGIIMSLDRFGGKWYLNKKAKFLTDAFYEDDGEKNMAVIERYITDQYTESDRNQQHWFELFGYCQIDEYQANENHDYMPYRSIGKACVCPEVGQVIS